MCVFLLVPPNAIAASVSRSGTARAGSIYNLTCTVSKTVDGLINSPTVSWTTDGEVIVSGDGITVFTMTINETSVSTLVFDPLRTSHGGQYSCDGTLTSLVLITELIQSSEETLQVQSK